MSEEADAYCWNEVRRGDADRFLSALFAPAAQRANLMALYAFNLEVARTREMVHEPMLGEIRLQWWQEAIAEIYAGRSRQHPVCLALADAIVGASLPQAMRRPWDTGGGPEREWKGLGFAVRDQRSEIRFT